jgi:ribosome maturation factor RimP
MQATELLKMIEPAVIAQGLELWGAEWVNEGNSRLLRIYVDSAIGVNLDQCAKVSRQVSAVLDVEDCIQGRYFLEVSSPGVERTLFTLDQCRRYLGHGMAIRLRMPKAGRRNFTGTLVQVENEQIFLQIENQPEEKFSWRDIDRAHLVARQA